MYKNKIYLPLKYRLVLTKVVYISLTYKQSIQKQVQSKKFDLRWPECQDGAYFKKTQKKAYNWNLSS